MLESLGMDALINIIVNLMVLVIVWWAVQSFKLDLFLKDPNGPKAKTFLIILTISITHLVSSFLLNYFKWATMLKHLL